MSTKGEVGLFSAAREDLEALPTALANVQSGALAMTDADLPDLATCLGDARKSVRRLAAGAMAAALGRREITPALCQTLLDSKEAAVRWGAAFALGRAGHPSSQGIETALAALDDEDGDIRWAAAAMIVAAARESDDLRRRLRLSTRSGGARLRKMALLCLCDAGERNSAIYVSALCDADPYVRMAGLTSLARSGDRSAVSLEAISVVANTDGQANVRRAAAAVHRRLTEPKPKREIE